MNALLTDTIAALATPPGRSSVAMFRVSGPAAFSVSDIVLRSTRPSATYASRTLHRAALVDPVNPADTIDDVLVAVFHAPNSYTGEDVVEITCHGGEIPVRRALELLLAYGARIADPGEFTLRAYLNGKLDLAQAEAVGDLIDARGEEAYRLAKAQQSGVLSAEVNRLRDQALGILARIEATIDFPEDVGDFPGAWCAEELQSINDRLERLIRTAGRGMLIRDGARVALVGSPNAGKSSLLNALLRQDRAIVTAVPGTTRDVIEESVTVNGIVLRLSDTAGIRESNDEVERLGINRSKNTAAAADIVVWVIDATLPPQDEQAADMRELSAGKPLLRVINKVDLLAPGIEAGTQTTADLAVSAMLGTGIEELEQELARIALLSTGGSDPESPIGQGDCQTSEAIVTHARHLASLQNALQAIGRAIQINQSGLPLDFLSIEVQTVLDALGTITGVTAPQDLLGEIFSKFCIGK